MVKGSIMSGQRVVKAGHGHAAAMGYKYRIRIESKQRKQFLILGKKVNMYRPVVERYFQSWEDCESGRWRKDKLVTIDKGNKFLDAIEKAPEGEYI